MRRAREALRVGGVRIVRALRVDTCVVGVNTRAPRCFLLYVNVTSHFFLHLHLRFRFTLLLLLLGFGRGRGGRGRGGILVVFGDLRLKFLRRLLEALDGLS